MNMKKKDIVILTYKVLKVIPKGNSNKEPDWEALKENPNSLKGSYSTEVAWCKKTFTKSGVISIEEEEDGFSVINHEEGTFVVDMKFKKLIKLIYK